MNKLFLFFACIYCALPFSAHAQKALSIIPKPKEIYFQSGVLSLKTPLKIAAFNDFVEVAELLKEHPYIAFEEIETIKKRKHIPENGIRFVLPEESDKLPENAYRLEVNQDGILFTAHNPQAMINAILTLVQIAYIQEDGSLIPYLKMEDAPRFEYRGLHLDVSRHFFPVSFLEKYIDLMAIYKLNTFHWDLTNAPGWRLEIKQYPKLTQKAAWRNYVIWKDWWNSPRKYAEMGSPNASGGFYTQEKARHLVNYAAKRGITIVPEIDIPGHSEEVLAVYPELSCAGLPYKNSAFCIGNEETFAFLNNVLSEVIDVFPSQYIHIGGDEVSKEAWKTCSKCQKRMKDEGLENVDELQSYAIKRIATFLNTKERKFIGWGEIFKGGLKEAISFDTYQSNPMDEPKAAGGFTPLSKVYAYSPVPKDVEDKSKELVPGIQANVWTGYMPTTNDVEYMVFPRALALSEVAWVSEDEKNWSDFEKRLQDHYLLLQRFDVNYYRPSFKPRIQARYNDKLKVSVISITSEQYQPVIHYTTDGTIPTTQSPRYFEPLELFKSAKVMAATFADSSRLGAVDSLQVDIHRAIGKKVIYNNPWDSYEAKGDSTLVNGIKGGLRYDDGEWQSFAKGGLDIVIDFERREELKSVSIRFMQLIKQEVYMPGHVSVEISDDGRNFKEVQNIKNDIPTDQTTLTFKNFVFNLNAKRARYIRVKATNPHKGLLFTDEIVVY